MRSKALAGATQGGADGRTSVDQLGTILTWIQERGGESFLFVTANDVTGLPELLRKGRFDEIFFVDLPNEEEQPKILQAALAANGRGPARDWPGGWLCPVRAIHRRRDRRNRRRRDVRGLCRWRPRDHHRGPDR